MAKEVRYSFSFTAASALITETIVIAEEFHRLKDWKAVEQSLAENNLLNKIKQATFKREFAEIKKRLSALNDDQLLLMIQGTLDDTKAMILLSLIKVYSFLHDFIIDVVRSKYLLFDPMLMDADYTKFVNSKSLVHNELNEITEVTVKKVKQVIFKLIEQVGLITQIKNGRIVRPMLSKAAIQVIVNDNPAMLAVFLYSNDEIKNTVTNLKHA
jgi:hypothetical protein